MKNMLIYLRGFNRPLRQRAASTKMKTKYQSFNRIFLMCLGCLMPFSVLSQTRGQPSRGRARDARSHRQGGKREDAPRKILSARARLELAINREAATHRIDPLLLWALIEQESGGHPGAVSYKGATGVMQLMPQTARRWGVRNPRDIDEAVKGGTLYLIWLIDNFDGNVALGLAGYNAGEGAVMAYRDGYTIRQAHGKTINPHRLRTGGIPPYAQTQEYVRKIASGYARLCRARDGQSNGDGGKRDETATRRQPEVATRGGSADDKKTADKIEPVYKWRVRLN